MFGLSFKTTDDTKQVAAAAEKANFRNLGHAAASIRKDAMSTIETSQVASEPGSPPNTRRGQIRRAIQFAVQQDSAVIGPVASMVGLSAQAQEFGGNYKGENYPARPFMGPALERATPRLAGQWAGTIGQ